MSLLPPTAERWLTAHHGVATGAALAKAGVPRRTAARLVRMGVLHRPKAGVFVLAGTEATLMQRAALLCAVHPTGFVTGPTAGVLAGLRRMPGTSPLHFSLRHGINPVPVPGVRIRQTTQIRASDRVARSDGITVASSVRLAFDLAADLGRLDHLSVVHQLLDSRRVTADELRAIGHRLCQPARPGSTRFAQTLERLGGGQAADSHPEVKVFDALRRAGVAVETQVSVEASFGVLHLDLGVPEARWGVELDIHPEHASLEGVQRDAHRRSETNAADWLVETITELDLERFEAAISRLTVSYAQRCQRLGVQPSTARLDTPVSVLG